MMELFFTKSSTDSGEKIQLGGNESYAPSCHSCYVERLPGAIERAYEEP